jgi:hypothetical protein
MLDDGAARPPLAEDPTRDDTDVRMDRFLTELLGGAAVGRAAESAGISRRTASRWRADAEFQRRYREARQVLLDEAISDLHTGAADAVRVLRGIANDEKQRGSDRVLGARHLLDLLLRGVETLDFAERIAKLESVAGEKP